MELFLSCHCTRFELVQNISWLLLFIHNNQHRLGFPRSMTHLLQSIHNAFIIPPRLEYHCLQGWNRDILPTGIFFWSSCPFDEYLCFRTLFSFWMHCGNLIVQKSKRMNWEKKWMDWENRAIKMAYVTA